MNITILMDTRLQQPPDYVGVPADVRQQIESLVASRNVCHDDDVVVIDAKVVNLLLPYATGASDAKKAP